MGMFGKRGAAYQAAGIEPPNIGGTILNVLGRNVLGVDFEKQRLNDALARQRAAFEQGLAQRVAGTPAGMEAAPVKAPDGTDISAAFSPQTKFNPGRAPLNINSPDLAGLSIEAQKRGYSMGGLLEVLKAQQPKYGFTPSNEMFDEKTGQMRPGVVTPKMGDGMFAVRGQGGDLLGATDVPGYAEGAGRIEGAKTGAQEQAKAQLDVIPVNMPDGSTVQLPRDVAVRAILQSLAGGQGAPGAGGGVGRSRPPEDTTYATDAAKAQVELDFTRPKAQAALTAMDAKTKTVDDAITRAQALVGAWTAGPGAMLSGIPGTPSRDLQASLETIKANLGFDELQTMRDNSPTGGALGQVAVQELEALRSTLSSLDQAQSPEALKASLARIQEIRKDSAQRRRQAFDATYGGARPPPGRPQQRAPAGPRTTGFRSRIISAE